jgi:hypothetical protein
LSVTEETVGGSTVTLADLLLELYEAVILDEEGAATAEVETVKVALDKPAPTVTLARTLATEVVPEERVMSAPPERAGPLRVTVPWEELVPTTLVGLSVTEKTTGVVARTVRVAGLLLVP